MPGPPPKPAELHRRLGNPSRKKLPDPSSVVPLAVSDGPPPAPDTLREHGRRAWERLWAAGGRWISPDTDVAVMTRLCEGYDLRADMAARLAADGLMVEGAAGQPRPHPLIAQILAVESMITKYEGLCGFTPADRARLGVAEVRPTADNAVDDFFAVTRARRAARFGGDAS
jgi:P27 family predicted phage terminase small subunit